MKKEQVDKILHDLKRIAQAMKQLTEYCDRLAQDIQDDDDVETIN